MTARLQNSGLQRAGGAELGAGPLQALRHAHQERLAVGHRIVELLDCDVECGQCAFLDRAVLEALQRVAQNGIRFRLHLVELFHRIAMARGGEHVQQPVADSAISPHQM